MSAILLMSGLHFLYLGTAGGEQVIGTIVRINQRTATIDTGNGTRWRVGFGLLRHALDI